MLDDSKETIRPKKIVPLLIQARKLYFIYTCHFHFCIFNLQSFELIFFSFFSLPISFKTFILFFIYSFLSKLIIIFVFLFLIALDNSVSTDFASFLFFDFFLIFNHSSSLRSSLTWFFIEVILADPKGSSCLTFAICCWKLCSICLSNISLFTKFETLCQKDCNTFLCD